MLTVLFEEKVGSIFSTHMHEIFVQVCEFHPLAATGAQINLSLSLSLTHSRLTSMFQVPTRGIIGRATWTIQTVKTRRTKNKQKEGVEKSTGKAKIVLDALQGVKSNGVWRDYRATTVWIIDVSTGKIDIFVRLGTVE